jgi:thiol-disulfide isomerase/thioredoxin
VAIVAACVCAFARTSRAGDDAWMTDFDAAKAKAKEEKKMLLVDFTGSDWCPWCIKLHKEVFDKEAFNAYSPTKFILVELDYPREKKLPDELKAQNDKLQKEYKIRGYPTVLLLDPAGEVLAQTGYRPGGPEKYVKHLGNLITLHESFVKMSGELAKAEGLDRAKLLDGLIEAVTELQTGDKDIDTWAKEIIALDSENKAGLKRKYEVRQLLSEVATLTRTRKLDEAHAKIQTILDMPGLNATQRQDAYAAEADLAQVKMDWPACLAALKKSIEAAPGSERAEMIKSNIARLEQMIKNEEDATKLKGELANAEGEARLKLLDETLNAFAKIGNRIKGKDESADVAKWMDEIITLDSDNKAGLKAKYEFQSYFNQAQKLLVSHKTKEALATIEKTLTLSNLTPQQVSRATLMKCNCLLIQKDYQGAIDCATKAQESATGMEAAIFRAMVQQAEQALKRQKSGNAAAADAIGPTVGGMLRAAAPAERVKAVAGQRASGKTAATEDSAASPKSADADKPVEKDPFKVPSGSVKDLLKYVAGLKKEKSKSSDHMAVTQFRGNKANAMLEAADKILAADPTTVQKALALKIKLDAFDNMTPSVLMPSDKLIAKEEELVEQCENAGMPKEAQQALRMVLSDKLQLSAGNGHDLEQILDKVKDFYRTHQIDTSELSLAGNAGRAAEYNGSNELAVQTYRELGKIIAAQKNKKVAQSAARFIGAARRLGLKENTMLVEGTTLEGKPLDWSKYSGKIVLIDFWATWCGPCRAELPNVRKNYEAYHDRGFEVIGVSLDQHREDLDKFMEKEKLPWTIVTDDSWNKEKDVETGDGEKLAPGQLANYYGVFGIPTMILLGKDGRAITLNARGEALTHELEKAFGPVVAKAKDEENK